jgi:radical SAM/Cys-rich protein
MRAGIIPKLIEYLEYSRPESLEITGGAPELNKNIVTLIRKIRPLVKKLTMRTNLTAMSLCSSIGFPDFLYEHKVGLVASLPCYTGEKVNSQRGSGVFEKSIRQLNHLNSLGFGIEDGVPVTLVYNPVDHSMPPKQTDVEKTFREKLAVSYGVKFTDLVTMTNVPVGRFAADLKEEGYFKDYIKMLSDSFNQDTLFRLMCLDQVTIDWKGRFYDCDFNLALDLPRGGWSSLDSYRDKHEIGRKIYTGYHCLACTAGAGSSCHGSLAGE